MDKPLSHQVGGGHYKEMPVQPVHFSMVNNFGFCEGNIVKYVSRWEAKGGIEDLRKAAHYLAIIMADSDYTLRFAKLRSRYGHAGMAPGFYCNKNGIQNPERGVIGHIWLWNAKGTRSDLLSAQKWLNEAIQRAQSI